MKNIQYLLFAILLVFSSCRKEGVTTDFEFEPTNSGETIETRLSGQVIDEAGLPLADAIVRIANKEQTTNNDGVFSFSNMDLKENGEMISIEKSGFFTNIKRVIPTANNTFQRLGLVAKGSPTGTFPSNLGGTISKPDGEKIVFQANSIVDESGDYNGEVTVFTHHFNPENPFLGEMMPGDLSGISDEGNRVQLATYSTMLVELYGSSGQKLNLKSGTTAAVDFPIRDSAIANALIDIPLWSLDELTGVWIEEGRATRDGDYYKAEVSHFSYWSCDEPFDPVNLEGQILDQNGNPIANTHMRIRIIKRGIGYFSTTNAEGRFTGRVPANEELILIFLDQCGNVFYTEIIGPFASDQQISLAIDNAGDLLTISGSLINCKREPITDGYVTIEIDDGIKYILPIDDNGDFNSTIHVCQTSELKIHGVDARELVQSSEKTIIYTEQESEFLGEILTCGEPLDEFILMTFEGNDYLLIDAEVVLEPEEIRIESNYEPTGDRFFKIDITNPQLGMNTPFIVYTGNNDFDLLYQCNNFSSTRPPCTGNVTVEITKLDDFIGGFIEGIVEGKLVNKLGDLEAVRIEFKVKIDYKLIEIGGRFWDDLNRDGIQDPDEPGIPDLVLASVVYFDGPGNGAHSYGATTASDGTYTLLMTTEKPGRLLFHDNQTRGEYIITPQGQGTDPTKDSDFDPSTRGVPDIIAIEGGVNQYDCGTYLR